MALGEPGSLVGTVERSSLRPSIGVLLPDPVPFAAAVAVLALSVIAVLGAGRLCKRIGVPLPVLVLPCAAVVAHLLPGEAHLGEAAVSRVVTVALVAVLYSGGMRIGRRRILNAARPVVTLGVAGTVITAGTAGVFLHFALGFGWYPALLIATAVAPTDPTVVFSLLGKYPLGGTVTTVLEGESGANDPVAIALMVALLAAKGIDLSGLGHAGATFGMQMSLGALIGVAGGKGLVWLLRSDSLGGPGEQSIVSLSAAAAIFGLAAAAGGSGFLAVFLAGIVAGDEQFAHKTQVRQFHATLATLGEIAAFVALGLTVNLTVIAKASTWAPGLALAAIVAVVARPVAVVGCLAGSGLSRPDRMFVAFAGLKGAVPILLGTYLLGAATGEDPRLFGIVVVVVLASVAVQGSLVKPASARVARSGLSLGKRRSTQAEL